MAEQKQLQIPQVRTATPNGHVSSSLNALTPKDIVGILRRHIFMMVSLTILGLLIGGISWYLLRKYAPKYTAATYVRVTSPTAKDPTIIGGSESSKEIQYGYRVSMASLMTGQGNLRDLVNVDTIKRTKWFKSFADPNNIDECIKAAVEDLAQNFHANPLRDGDFIVVSMTCGSPEESALIVNEMIDLFVNTQGASTKADIQNKLKGLSDEEAKIQQDLLAAENVIDDIRKQTKFTDLKEHGFQQEVEIKLSSLQLEQNQRIQEKNRVETNVKILQQQVDSPIDAQIENAVETDPTMIMLTQQLATQETTLAGLLTRFGETHREVRRMQEMINETKAKREARQTDIANQTRQANLKNTQDALIVQQQNLEDLQKLIDDAAAKKQDLDLARAAYERQAAIRDAIKSRLDDLRNDITKWRIMLDDPDTPKVHRVTRAPEPLKMSSPLWYTYFPGGTFLGLMLGVGLAFLVELLNDKVRTPRDVIRFLQIPLLGIIPDADEDDSLTNNADLCRIVLQSPYSIISESYRRLKSNLKLSVSSENSKVLLVSSGNAGEGKTAVAVNLACALIGEGKKILIIDANFWRPKLHKVFPNSNGQQEQNGQYEQSEFGLSTLLTGLGGYQEAIRSTGIDGFDVIDSGLLPSDPTELLSGVRMEQLISRQRENYDYIIIDGPPALLVSAVKPLARHVDGTLLVFNADSTHRGAAMRTIREFREVNATLFGCVLFAVKAMKGGYFDEQFKSYQKYRELQLANPT